MGEPKKVTQPRWGETLSSPDQLSFPELEFGPDRTALTVAECARKLGYTDEHVISLIECGQLTALNCATKFDTVRVPRGFLAALAPRLGRTESEIFAELERFRAAAGPSRRPSYRIPPSAWAKFLQNHVAE